MTHVPPVPTDPAALKAWLDNASRDEVMALAQQMASGDFLRGFGPLGGGGWIGATVRSTFRRPPRSPAS